MKKSYFKKGTWRKLQNVSSTEIGKNPLTTRVKRNTNLIFVTKEGYQDTLIYCMLPKIKIEINNTQTGKTKNQKIMPAKYQGRINGWYWGNLILGDYVGLFIDLGTGACYSLDKTMYVTLKSK